MPRLTIALDMTASASTPGTRKSTRRPAPRSSTGAHVKKTSTSVTVKNTPESRPSVSTPSRQTACSENAMPMASSRPVLSDTQPQKMRLAPLASALNEVASVRNAALMPQVFAIGPALAVTSRPPVAIITNIA